MRNNFLNALIIGSLLFCETSCSPERPLQRSHQSTITYEGGDGSTIETAILIKGAESDQDGVAGEYTWLRQNRPGYNNAGQEMLNIDTRQYDVLYIVPQNPKPKTLKNKQTDQNDNIEKVYFDITDFFGKKIYGKQKE